MGNEKTEILFKTWEVVEITRKRRKSQKLTIYRPSSSFTCLVTMGDDTSGLFRVYM